MNEKILAPKFVIDEPNLISTREKNAVGKCCFSACANDLPKTEQYHYMGFLACEECGKKFKAEEQKISDDLFLNFFQKAIDIAKE